MKRNNMLKALTIIYFVCEIGLLFCLGVNLYWYFFVDVKDFPDREYLVAASLSVVYMVLLHLIAWDGIGFLGRNHKEKQENKVE